MALVWERKGRSFANNLARISVLIILTAVNFVVITWLLHMLYAIFSDSLTHMSLIEWAEHLYSLLKQSFG